MARRLTVLLSLVIFGLQPRGGHADPIRLLSIESSVTTDITVGDAKGVGSLWFPQYLPLTFDYSSQGGHDEFMGGAINPVGTVADTEQAHTVHAQFYFNLAALVPGSTDKYQGPELDISGQATGTLTGPGVAGSDWRWSGGYSGTATAASLWPLGSQDVSQLPAPLLDILHHPDHFHLSVFVTGGSMNDLDVTLALDPPSPAELPEPTALITLVAGSAALLLRRWRCRAV
jgi:hypothetical protein